METPISSDQSINDSSLKELLEENNRLLQEVKAGNDKVLRYLRWSQIWSFLRVLIILVPIILGVLYLKPYVQNVFSTYRDLLGVPTGSNNSSQSLDLLDELKKYQR